MKTLKIESGRFLFTHSHLQAYGGGGAVGDSDAADAPIKSVLYGWFVYGGTELLEMAVQLAGTETVRRVFLSCIWDCPVPEEFDELMRRFENG